MKKLAILSILVIFTSIGCDTIKVKYGNKGDNNTSKPEKEQVDSSDNISQQTTNVEDIMNSNNLNNNDNLSDNDSDNNSTTQILNHNHKLLLDNSFGVNTLNSYINRYDQLEKSMKNNFALFNNKINTLEDDIKFYQNETDNMSVKIANLNNQINNLTIENNASINLITKFKNYFVIFFIVILAVIISLIFVIGSVYLRLWKIKKIIQKEPAKHVKPAEEKKKPSTRKNMTVIDTNDDEKNNDDGSSNDNK